MVRVLHNGVCWLLSAVLLLTNGWPVSIRHAHDVGENPYHHSHRTAASSLHASPAIGDADGEVSGVTDHVHMLWFGWEVTVLPPKGSRPAPTATAVGILAQQGDRSPLEGDAVGVGSANSPAVVAAEPVDPFGASRTLADSVHRVAALPLCDTARHLRSGVQLA
jgi:hypothetical protein